MTEHVYWYWSGLMYNKTVIDDTSTKLYMEFWKKLLNVVNAATIVSFHPAGRTPMYKGSSPEATQ